MKNVYIASLRCAPGLQKEIECISAGFARNAWRCQVLLAEAYRPLWTSGIGAEFVPTSRGYVGMLRDLLIELRTGALRSRLRRCGPDLLIFYNLSPLNLLLAREAAARSCKVGIVLHDPWKTEKFRHNTIFGLTYLFVESLQKRLVKRCDHLITLSNYGTLLVKRNYPGAKGKIIEGRILLPARSTPRAVARKSVSIIGRINPSTGHEEFISLAADLRQKLPDVTFEIVTSSPEAVKPSFARRAAFAGVRIEYRGLLSEEEIEKAVARSICVFRLDTELTQSGVLPLCYRAGTPVIARNIPGLSQHVTVGRTGYLFCSRNTSEEVADYITQFAKKPEAFSENCKQAFRENWAEENFEHFYKHLIG